MAVNRPPPPSVPLIDASGQLSPDWWRWFYRIPLDAAGLGLATIATTGAGSDLVGTVPIAHGGTNTSTQTTNGVAYYDGTKITTGAPFTWNATSVTVNLNAATAQNFGFPVQAEGADGGGAAGFSSLGIGTNGVFVGFRANGTGAAPTAVQAGDLIAVHGSGGRASTVYKPGTGGLAIYADQNWTDIANGTYCSLDTTAINNVPPALHRLEAHQGILINGVAGAQPTGGDKGVGTINAAFGYYVNGAALAAPHLADTIDRTNFNPTDASGAGLAFSAVSVNYFKIGNLVHVYGTLTYQVTPSGLAAKITLPVAVPNQPYAATTGAAFNNTAAVAGLILIAVQNTSTAAFASGNAAVTNVTLSGATVNFMLIYPAA